ncbi:hypothetical protein CR513_06281, partial [Mucuna pruriens]
MGSHTQRVIGKFLKRSSYNILWSEKTIEKLNSVFEVNRSSTVLTNHFPFTNMFRSTSTRRGPAKYEKLDKEYVANGTSNEEFKRSRSLPSRASMKMAIGSTFGDTNLQRNPTKKANSNPKDKEKKSHPLFSFFDLRRKKKATARPELARYLEYVKEGGMWDLNSNKPVIYYK